ncbi:MAG: hypothetical protein AAF704_04465 [Cyanobacteria bacterium P01_D01_bin.123]
MDRRFTRAKTAFAALGSFAIAFGPILAAAGVASAITPEASLRPQQTTIVAQQPDVHLSAAQGARNNDRAVSPSVSDSVSEPPLFVAAPSPEQRQVAAAKVAPVAGEVSVELVNMTYADVNYQLLGHTQVRTLPGRSAVTLRGADVPTTLTFQRQDAGLLSVIPQTSNKDGLLSISLDETLDLEQSRVVMTVEPSGEVFLN